jgi:hypothetical protein
MTQVAPESRTYGTRLELVDTELTGKPYRYLEGRAVPYDTWGDVGMFMERHAGDSFKHSTSGGAGKKLPLMLFHDRARIPVGVAEKWTHDDGLTGVWRLDASAEASAPPRRRPTAYWWACRSGFSRALRSGNSGRGTTGIPNSDPTTKTR